MGGKIILHLHFSDITVYAFSPYDIYFQKIYINLVLQCCDSIFHKYYLITFISSINCHIKNKSYIFFHQDN